MKVATWNINSIRARIPNVVNWIAANKPDVLLLQEIKCETDTFPRFEFEAMGYKTYVKGQKSYNGVAILSLASAANIRDDLIDGTEGQSRYIEAEISGTTFSCIYLPNGNPVGGEKFSYKLDWMKRLYERIKCLLTEEKPFVIGGDFNVIPSEDDVYDPSTWKSDALFHPNTLREYHNILNLGLTDAFKTAHPNAKHSYSFWDYQGGAWPQDKGLRIDHFLLSPEASDRLVSCKIDKNERGKEKSSDHAPVILEITD